MSDAAQRDGHWVLESTTMRLNPSPARAMARRLVRGVREGEEKSPGSRTASLQPTGTRAQARHALNGIKKVW